MPNTIDESNYTGDQLEDFTTEQLEMFTSEQLDEIDGSHLDIEIFEAGIEAEIEFNSIEGAYAGDAPNDEDFAWDYVHDTFDMTGIPSIVSIDWERTARDLLMNYSDADGHYFRNF
ncbi:MAG: hypothetical protein GQ468_02890 [Candidatus Scalindua sp.]|nr:hypothetical protein [Candidatus Scalindua sp.]